MRVAAFFDIDETVLSVNTAPLYARYMRRHGKARRRDLLRTAFYLLQYRLNLLDIDRAMERASGLIAGQSESEVAAFCEQWYREVVRAYLVPEMVGRIEHHRRAGHELALLSSSTNYLAQPLARDLVSSICSSRVSKSSPAASPGVRSRRCATAPARYTGQRPSRATTRSTSARATSTPTR